MHRSKEELRLARKIRRVVAFAIIGALALVLGTGLFAATRSAERTPCVGAVCSSEER